MTPQEFISKWQRVTAREKQTYQEHFLDICQLVGHQTPNEYDPTGTRFAFEMGAAKTSGGQGWADVAKLGFFGWEYKGKDADLDKAYEQLLRYRDALQNPPVLVVSDINFIVIRTNYTNLPTRTYTLGLEDLLKPESIDLLKKVFTSPEDLKPKETIESVTREAAEKFAKLAKNLRDYGETPQDVAHFLIRLLFCLFAEDIGLLPEKLFPRLLEQTRRNARDFQEVLRQLFRAMNTGGYFGSDKILHFNGGLFDDDRVLKMDGADMDIIADIDGLDWGAIKPSIFGTLFERGLDPGKRSQLGAHYTGEDDILLIVEPVLMAPLRREWKALQVECRKLKVEEEKERGKKKEGLRKKIQSALFGFMNKVDSVKVLDPACGSGNFLYVALRLLLDLQNEVAAFTEEMGINRPFVTVTPAQLYGIETNEYAHELAQMTIQIGYIQWLRDNGYGHPNEPILQKTKNIVQMDAIMSVVRPDRSQQEGPALPKSRPDRSSGDLSGLVGEPEWPAVDVIIGNPPFLGASKMRGELGEEYTKALFNFYGDRLPACDLVCYWFEKARAMIEEGKAKRAGLLATQAIRGGANRKVLERIKETGEIFWAQSDRDWILDGATVHVSMIGFDDGKEKHRILDNKNVTSINSNLTSTSDTTKANRLSENSDLAFSGTKKGGAFDIPEVLAKEFLLAAGNPSGKSNSDVIKPWLNGQAIVGTPTKNTWIIDFGNMDLSEASQYEAPFEYIKKHVFPERQKNNRARRRDYWWQHSEVAIGLRNSIKGFKRYIATPRVSKHRVFIWVDSVTTPDDGVYIFPRQDDYFFGVLHSKLHELWARSTGTQLREAESGFRYTPTSTFETFPLPYPPGKEKQNDPKVKAIAQAAKELVEQRDRWLNADLTPSPSPKGEGSLLPPRSGRAGEGSKKRTLTNLYNQRPTWLELAHKKLDDAVFAAYGWENTLSDEEILERLLALNLERSKK
ncbi:MAG: class I SAM-dependent DNA methyltransferase [Anaerolineales bacterium]|nr:class I SAM-dependent DNA methyltransferase [Anaerolineales bacterium]